MTPVPFISSRPLYFIRALPQAVGRLALSLAEEWPETELYWFLISQSFRTYRFLPVFFREFYPRFDVATQPPCGK